MLYRKFILTILILVNIICLNYAYNYAKIKSHKSIQFIIYYPEGRYDYFRDFYLNNDSVYVGDKLIPFIEKSNYFSINDFDSLNITQVIKFVRKKYQIYYVGLILQRKQEKLYLVGINILSKLNKQQNLEVAFKFDEKDFIEVINKSFYLKRELKNKKEIEKLNFLFTKVYKYKLFEVIKNE